MYCLYGIVGKSRDLLHKRLEYPGAGVVHLEQGIGMIPISEELLNAIEQGETSLGATEEPGFEFLSEVMLAWARRLSKGTTLAYIEAEFISGEGTESAVVWRDGVLQHGRAQLRRARIETLRRPARMRPAHPVG